MSEHGSPSLLLDRSLAELQARLEQQRALVRALSPELDGAPCPLICCPCSERLRAALIEAVAVLEETRRSFKSRQLESLRRRLQDVLASA
jgi:hypothetical protein